MADATHIQSHAPRRSFWTVLVDWMAPVGQRFVSMGENSSRYRRLERLTAMSDAELAARGLKREDIVRYVFADVYYV